VGPYPDLTEQLRSLPDMEPPPGAWQRLRARLRRRRPLAWATAALAACAGVVAVVLLMRGAPLIEPTLTEFVSTQADPAEVRDLRRRSQQMERLLRGLPPRRQVVRANVAGSIAELQDRIAAVDYELNRAPPPSVAVRRWPAGAAPSGFVPSQQSGPAPTPPARDLWRQRVDLMDRLVRVRFEEAGAEAY